MILLCVFLRPQFTCVFFFFRKLQHLKRKKNTGYDVLYDRECPFELRMMEISDESPEIGTLEAIKVKILVLTEEDDSVSRIRVELSSESDIFFYYAHEMDETGFRLVQEQQKLMVDFDEYPNVMIKMLNDCIKEPHSHLAVFVMARDGCGHLDFIQNMEYKYIELLSADFKRCPDDIVRSQIAYRYRVIKAKLEQIQSRQHDMFSIVKNKNPSLLVQLQRAEMSSSDASMSTPSKMSSSNTSYLGSSRSVRSSRRSGGTPSSSRRTPRRR